MDFSEIPSWVWWAGGTALAAGVYWYWSSSSSAAQDQTAVDGSLAGAYPSLTYAAPAALGGSAGDSLGVGTDTSGLNALSTIMNSLAGPTQQEITTELNAATAAGVAQGAQTSGVTVFKSLLGYLNQHKGLHQIQATVPGLGTISVGPQPKKIVTKTVYKPTPKPVAKPKAPPLPKAHVVAAKPAVHVPAHSLSSHHTIAVKHA
jgi:hypothetical protein